MKLTLDKRSDDVYKILKKLGSGSFGTTYLVEKENKNDGKTYVLKEIKIKPANITDVFSEINILTKIAKSGCNKYVLCYHDYFINPSLQTINIITDAFEDSITLSSLIKTYQRQQQLFSRDELLKIMNNLLSGLSYLHKLGIAHGDIKPENILINKNLETQIIDFGLSCSKHCKPSGTILYTSPEILIKLGSKKEISLDTLQTADVFSMGIVFYLLANLQFPYTIVGNNPYNYDNNSTNNIITNDSNINDKFLTINTNNSLRRSSSQKEIPQLDNTIINIDGLKKYLFEVNNDNDLSAILSLGNFYKNRGNFIYSFYNFNETDIDTNINKLIESMLIIKTKEKKSRPSAKRLLGNLNKIIIQYNTSKAILGKRREILVSPISPDNNNSDFLQDFKF